MSKKTKISGPVTLATWNINSIRARLDLMRDFLEQYSPDILCLQETKVRDDQFPHELFEVMGYTTRLIKGQPGYNGVAIFAATRSSCRKNAISAAATTAAISRRSCPTAPCCITSTFPPAA